jgi:hypothetical protein
MMTLVHRLDGLRASAEPLRDETVHHQIGKAVIEIRDETIEMLGEFRLPYGGAKSIQEGPGTA